LVVTLNLEDLTQTVDAREFCLPRVSSHYCDIICSEECKAESNTWGQILPGSAGGPRYALEPPHNYFDSDILSLPRELDRKQLAQGQGQHIVENSKWILSDIHRGRSVCVLGAGQLSLNSILLRRISRNVKVISPTGPQQYWEVAVQSCDRIQTSQLSSWHT
jgi:hypothetical protein